MHAAYVSNQMLSFNSTTPNGYAGQPTQRVQNIQVDAQGNILFFIVDEMIYDRQGKFLVQLFSKT